VGGGAVALRKVLGLVEEGALVTVVAPRVVAAIEERASSERIVLERREYRTGEAADYALVIAATDQRNVNRQVFEDADGAGVWVNVADDPELCSFHLPARVRRGPLEMAVSSGGSAPFATRRMRQLLERRFGPEWTPWAEAAAAFREEARSHGLSVTAREAAFERFFTNTVDGQRLRARVPSEEEMTSWLGADDSPPAPPQHEARAPTDLERGWVALVGAGPGNAGLLTLRGRQRLLSADDVVYDRLAAAALPCDLPDTVVLHPVGKEAGNHPTAQEQITALLVRLGHEGRRVVRLKGGDPFVFGRGSEEAEALAAADIPFEIVPGVTSGIAAPAWMGIPVTHRREAVRLTLVTAHESVKGDGPQVRWDLLAQDPHGTLVGYMGVTPLARVVKQLLDGGMDPGTPAAMVEQGTTAAQRRVLSTLAELPAAVRQAGLKPPALFVIGPTVKHAERLDWVSRRPLSGERLVVPEAAQAAVEALEAAGADVVPVPQPVTAAARVVMRALPLTGCFMRTREDVESLGEERDGLEWQKDAAVWCLGSETAERARARRWPGVREIEKGSGGSALVEQIRERASAR
jgi:uroporphyrin-III C-methyltransferase/precorrin-2 dehydrogenase/sirohydrochlorin ferrochelatase